MLGQTVASAPDDAIGPMTTRPRRSAAPLGHRAEIDGLRAVAILPILLLHCGVEQLRGGYVGVDIFFVISGYLITAIVEREIAEGTFTLSAFYRRRIVRILPALLAMVTVVLAVGSLELFPVPLRDLGLSAAATALFGSNFYFYATTDYFAQASELKPLVHTWSLAVEEQFYLLYPPLLLMLRGLSRQRLAVVMQVLAAASIAVGGYLALSDPTAGYYLLPARTWELLLGALVAIGAHPRVDSSRLRSLLCWIALGVILASTAVTKPTWPFPVPFALPPAVGAALLLAYAPGTPAAALLSWRPLRWIGFISYSLYLWHRPIIAWYLLGRSWEMNGADTAVLLAMSFAAATLSYWLIERPALRRWRRGTGTQPHIAAAGALVALALGSMAIAATAGHVRHLPPDVARVVDYIGFDKTPAGIAQYRTDTCFVLPYGKPFVDACLAPARGRPNVLLVGDSHAAQLSEALRDALAPAHVMQATAAGCRPLLVTKGLESCHRLVLRALTRTDIGRVSGVVLAGRWFDVDVDGLTETIRYLRAKGVPRVVVMGPMVEYQGDMPDLLGRAMLAGDLGRLAQTRTPDRAALSRTMEAAVRGAGGEFVSYFALECPAGRCALVTPDGAPIHVDQAHLTPQAARPVAALIARALALPRR